MSNGEQKRFLQGAKQRLRRKHPGLTWDGLAELAHVEPRTLKTYRMPEQSLDYRVMPKLVRANIEALVHAADAAAILSNEASVQHESADQASRATFESILPSALAALVIRQTRLAVIERRPISGVDRHQGEQVGLTREDRYAMSLVSRARLRQGQTDVGAEIHELLACCARPLGEWLPLPFIHSERLSAIVLLDPEQGMPTAEADELAQRFVSATASIEELLFSRFQEQLGKGSRLVANASYTRVREFVVRNPVATREQIAAISTEVPSAIAVLINQEFYEPIPDGWAYNGDLAICDHCHNAIQTRELGHVCRTRACADALPLSSRASYRIGDSLRLTRGLRQYWQEPGFDEIRLFDELVQAGHKPVLYPRSDRVDIEVGEVGIDLKAYVSPELLASRLNRTIGGLIDYRHKWLVIPDRIVRRVPAYLDRLTASLRQSGIRVLAASAVTNELSHA